MVVIEQANGRFTNYLPLEFVQDGCDNVDQLHLGDKVSVSYRLTGRKWQRDEHSEVKYFLSAEATGFQLLSSAAGNAAVAQAPEDGYFGPEDESAPF